MHAVGLSGTIDVEFDNATVKVGDVALLLIKTDPHYNQKKLEIHYNKEHYQIIVGDKKTSLIEFPQLKEFISLMKPFQKTIFCEWKYERPQWKYQRPEKISKRRLKREWCFIVKHVEQSFHFVYEDDKNVAAIRKFGWSREWCETAVEKQGSTKKISLRDEANGQEKIDAGLNLLRYISDYAKNMDSSAG